MDGKSFVWFGPIRSDPTRHKLWKHISIKWYTAKRIKSMNCGTAPNVPTVKSQTRDRVRWKMEWMRMNKWKTKNTWTYENDFERRRSDNPLEMTNPTEISALFGRHFAWDMLYALATNVFHFYAFSAYCLHKSRLSCSSVALTLFTMKQFRSFSHTMTTVSPTNAAHPKKQQFHFFALITTFSPRHRRQSKKRTAKGKKKFNVESRAQFTLQKKNFLLPVCLRLEIFWPLVFAFIARTITWWR